jgi:DNA-binding response OmpR family regulator
VLVVEDYAPVRGAVLTALRDEGWSVDAAGDGAEGLRLAQSAGYDVIILDVMLPSIGGFEVLRLLREREVKGHVIMLTARDEVSDRVQGLDLGADDYMVKPFAVAELLARVRALGRRGARQANGRTQLRAGDLMLDVSRHSAVRGDREIELTVKEFQLLELLLRHQGQVLSRSQILDHVWQYDRDFASNVVDIYIHYLRNKVDKGFDRQLIHTIRGVGYTLKP